MKVVVDIPEIPKNDKQRWALANGTPYAHGEWIRQRAQYGYANTCECSLCGRVIYAPTEDDLSDFPYCHCGADMREGDEK